MFQVQKNFQFKFCTCCTWLVLQLLFFFFCIIPIVTKRGQKLEYTCQLQEILSHTFEWLFDLPTDYTRRVLLLLSPKMIHWKDLLLVCISCSHFIINWQICIFTPSSAQCRNRNHKVTIFNSLTPVTKAPSKYNPAKAWNMHMIFFIF